MSDENMECSHANDLRGNIATKTLLMFMNLIYFLRDFHIGVVPFAPLHSRLLGKIIFKFYDHSEREFLSVTLRQAE